MYAQGIDNELTAYSALTVTNAQELERLSFHPRREVIEAARVANPGNPLAYYAANHAAVVASAKARAVANIR